MIASDKFNDSPACSEFVIVDGHGNELTVAQLEAVEWTPLEELAVTEEPDREQISDWMLAVDEKVCLLPCGTTTFLTLFLYVLNTSILLYLTCILVVFW